MGSGTRCVTVCGTNRRPRCSVGPWAVGPRPEYPRGCPTPCRVGCSTRARERSPPSRTVPGGTTTPTSASSPMRPGSSAQVPLPPTHPPSPPHVDREFHPDPQPETLQPKHHPLDWIGNDKFWHQRDHCPRMSRADVLANQGILFHKSSAQAQNPESNIY